MSDPFVDRYALEEKLGAGASATVYRALDRNTGRTVAIKFLAPAEDTAIPQLYERFLQEAALLARVRSPYVVDILDLGEYQTSPYLVMEFLEGIDLGELVAARGPQDPRRVRTLALCLAEGLAAIHEAGVIHRDLKPANVLLRAEDHPKISDLGLARAEIDSGVHTETGLILGSPGFMAPEVLRAQPAGPPADVFALGMILYYLLTARLPFEGASPGELFRETLRGVPSEAMARVPEAWVGILTPMTVLSPEERIELPELASKLERLEDLSSRARARPRPPRAPMGSAPAAAARAAPTGRAPSRGLPLLLGLAAVALAGAFVWAPPRPVERPEPLPATPAPPPLDELVRGLGAFSLRRELAELLGDRPAERIHLLLRRGEEEERRRARASLHEQVREAKWYPPLKALRTRLPARWWTEGAAPGGLAPEERALRRKLLRRLGDLAHLPVLARILGGARGELLPEVEELLGAAIAIRPLPDAPPRADHLPGGHVLQEGCRLLATHPERSAAVGSLVVGVVGPPACREDRVPGAEEEATYPFQAVPGGRSVLRLGYYTAERANFLEVAFLDSTRNPLFELPLAFPELASRFKRFSGPLGVEPGDPLLVEITVPTELLVPDARALRFRIRNLAGLVDPEHIGDMLLAGVQVAELPPPPAR